MHSTRIKLILGIFKKRNCCCYFFIDFGNKMFVFFLICFPGSAGHKQFKMSKPKLANSKTDNDSTTNCVPILLLKCSPLSIYVTKYYFYFYYYGIVMIILYFILFFSWYRRGWPKALSKLPRLNGGFISLFMYREYHWFVNDR